jgi:hypothetical protein
VKSGDLVVAEHPELGAVCGRFMRHGAQGQVWTIFDPTAGNLDIPVDQIQWFGELPHGRERVTLQANQCQRCGLVKTSRLLRCPHCDKLICKGCAATGTQTWRLCKECV